MITQNLFGRAYKTSSLSDVRINYEVPVFNFYNHDSSHFLSTRPIYFMDNIWHRVWVTVYIIFEPHQPMQLYFALFLSNVTLPRRICKTSLRSLSSIIYLTNPEHYSLMYYKGSE